MPVNTELLQSVSPIGDHRTSKVEGAAESLFLYQHMRHQHAGCHFWAHTNPILFLEWVEQLRGESALDQLRALQGAPSYDLSATDLRLKAVAKEYGVKP